MARSFAIPLGCIVFLFISGVSFLGFEHQSCEALFFWGSDSNVPAKEEDIETDYYEVLELGAKGSDSTEQEIKKQFRVLSKKYHPDLNPTEEARGKYLQIQRAYEVLSDRRKRKVYDMRGEKGLKQFETQEKGGGGNPINSIFNLFGGGNSAAPQRGQDVHIQVMVPLRDIYSGATHSIQLQKQKLCRHCKGLGAASKSDLHTCDECQGSGVVIQNVRLGPGMIQRIQSACRKCGGKGKIIKKQCPVCHGHKVTRGNTKLDVMIERGVHENATRELEMEADESPDILPGDVKLHITSIPDATFERMSNQIDLSMKAAITLKESLLGFVKTFPHLDDHAIKIDRSDVVTPHLHKSTLKGEGMPHHNVPSEFGNLNVQFEVNWGKRKELSPQQKAKLKELLAGL